MKNIFFLFLIILTAYNCQGPRCNDGIMNGDESEIDCGGICGPCYTCDDGIRNQGEFAIDCGGPCPNACPNVWEEKYSAGDRNAREAFSRMSFPEENIGYFIRRDGSVFKTTDGGNTITQLPALQEDYGIEKIYFINRNSGFLFADNYQSSSVTLPRFSFLKTENGGQSWDAISFGAHDHTAHHFVSEQIGYISVFLIWNTPDWSEIRKTTDGGKTWTTVSDFQNHTDNHPTYGVINNLFFHDENNGIAISGNKTFKTTDGGNSWNVLGWHGLDMKPQSLQMFDENNGLVLAGYESQNNDSSVFPHFTTDGGKSWILYDIPFREGTTPTLYYNGSGYHFKNLSEGYYFSSDNPFDFTLTYKTTDMGENWKNIGTFVPKDGEWRSIDDVDCTEAGDCYILIGGSLYSNKIF